MLALGLINGLCQVCLLQNGLMGLLEIIALLFSIHESIEGTFLTPIFSTTIKIQMNNNKQMHYVGS